MSKRARWRGRLLEEALPEFAAELRRLLMAENRPDLSAQVEQLRVTMRDTCGDDFCQSFYVGGAKPRGTWQDEGEYESLELIPEEGMVILDLVDGRIRFVEVLYRDDVEDALKGAGIR